MPSVEFRVERTPFGYKVVEHCHQHCDSWDSEEDLILATYVTSITPGPIRGVFEWRSDFEFSLIESSIYHERALVDISDELARDEIHTTIIQYAKADPSLARFYPGQTGYWELSIAAIARTSFKVVLVVASAVVFARIILSIPKWPGWIIHEHRLERVRLGLCGYCGYDRSGLGTACCPECGADPMDLESEVSA